MVRLNKKKVNMDYFEESDTNPKCKSPVVSCKTPILHCSVSNEMVRFIQDDNEEVVTIRLKINKSHEFRDVEIMINCPEVDERLSRLIQQINQMMFSIHGKKDGNTYPIISDELLYIESVNDTTFLYTDREVFESDKKLYEFEEQLVNTRFLRISKNFIVNTSKIENVKALINGRFETSLSNGEKVIVNRHYVKSFRKHFLG